MDARAPDGDHRAPAHTPESKATVSQSPARRTRIVATLGPSSGSIDVMTALVAGGLDVARLNFSHGAAATHGTLARRLRRVARAAGRPVALLADLAGPKIRLGDLGTSAAVELPTGGAVTLTSRAITGTPDLLPVRHPALRRDVRPGSRVLLADGTVVLEVTARRGKDVRCRIVDGGHVRSRAGVNLPDSRVSARSPTARDLRDLELALELGADHVALSFVQSAADVRRLRRRMSALGADVPIVAKIEKPQALDALDDILEAADAVMVARGDLGVECPPEEVPLAQKRIIALANERAKPVITATQMLESMVTETRPTRAEASDVANAILDGSDAVMLSAETATGDHPALAVRMMAAIARRTEASEAHRRAMDARRDALADPGDITEAVVRAARHAAEHATAAALLIHTETGHSARRLARQRPRAPTVALCQDAAVARQLQLVHGMTALVVRRQRTTDALIATGLAAVREQGLLPSGALVVVVAGSQALAGASNLVKLDVVP